MSSNAHIRRHRKPRVSSRNSLLSTGVAGGVLTTLAVTGASAPVAAESGNAADTVEMPSLGTQVSSGTDQAVYATQSIAVQYELAAEKAQAEEAAQKTAAKAKKVEVAKKKAAAERKAAAEARAAERAAEQRSARSAERAAPAAQDSPAETTTPSSPATGTAAAVANFARAQVGKAYVMGSTGPNAYDCSGLTTAAFKQVGVSLPRTSQQQSAAGTEVGLGNLQPGDVLYWGGKGSATHVAIYVGDGKYVGAQNPNSGVAEHPLNWGGSPSGAVRFL